MIIICIQSHIIFVVCNTLFVCLLLIFLICDPISQCTQCVDQCTLSVHWVRDQCALSGKTFRQRWNVVVKFNISPLISPPEKFYVSPLTQFDISPNIPPPNIPPPPKCKIPLIIPPVMKFYIPTSIPPVISPLAQFCQAPCELSLAQSFSSPSSKNHVL